MLTCKECSICFVMSQATQPIKVTPVSMNVPQQGLFCYKSNLSVIFEIYYAAIGIKDKIDTYVAFLTIKHLGYA